MERKKYVVTGGAGFIGSYCVEALVARGEQVTVFDTKPEGEAIHLEAVRDRIAYVTGDIRDRSALESVLKDATHVLHLAAIVSVPESIADPIMSHDVNVTGTLNVFESARAAKAARVVYASSAAVYGDAMTVPIVETAPCEPLSPYGLHKVMNEEYGQLYHTLYGLSTCGLRFFNVYGSRQDPRSPYSGVVAKFVACVQRGESPIVYGDGSATRDYVHASDVARACIAALDHEEVNGVLNVGSGKAISITELIAALGESAGITITPSYTDSRAGDILHSHAEVSKIEQSLGFTPTVALIEGLSEIIQNT